MEYKPKGKGYTYTTFFFLAHIIWNMPFQHFCTTDILHHKHFRLHFSNTVSCSGKKALIKNKKSKLRMDHLHCLIFSRVSVIDACFSNSVPEELGNHLFFNGDSAAWLISANWHVNVQRHGIKHQIKICLDCHYGYYLGHLQTSV